MPRQNTSTRPVLLRHCRRSLISQLNALRKSLLTCTFENRIFLLSGEAEMTSQCFIPRFDLILLVVVEVAVAVSAMTGTPVETSDRS